MNIIVTSPFKESGNNAREAQHIQERGGAYFRVFRFRPKIFPGDKIYFTEGGLINGFGVIKEVRTLAEPLKCETTGRVWGEKGYTAIFYNEWTFLKLPTEYKSFRGFRYVENNPGLQTMLNHAERYVR